MRILQQNKVNQILAQEHSGFLLRWKYNSILAIAMLIAPCVFFFSCKNSSPTADQKIAADSSKTDDDSTLLSKYGHSELKTNWSKHLIPIDSIHDGGVGKNDIPAIDYPEFFTVAQAHGFLTEPDFGIMVEAGGEQKFYPLNILNWHEVVNDFINEVPVAITFCPLCGTAIAYNRIVDGDTLLFGVSGRVYESNLLMFDEKTESLWSQALGECVAGDLTGKKLSLFNSAIISFEEVENNFPDAKVLSIKTGYDRNYTRDPYAEYVSNDELYFPVSKKNASHANKDMMYVVQIGNTSVAFPWKQLLKKGSAEIKTDDGTVAVQVKNYLPAATRKEDQSSLNGYFSYWFSWYAMNGTTGKVWEK